MTHTRLVGSLFLIAVMASVPAAPRAETGASGFPIPRYVTVRPDEANLRAGPGRDYPIEWTYVRPGLPVEVIDEFDTWRQVRDHEGVEGWMHSSLLAGDRNVIVQGDDIHSLREDPASDAQVIALVEPGVLGGLVTCPPAESPNGAWCLVDIEGYQGWLPRTALYGVYPFEEVR